MLGALISGGLGLLGGMMANDARADESASNRAFQERMRNTSYQAAMEDMRKAGLNPMLAYSQGGAAVPSGSMASFENPGLAGAQAYAAATSAQAAETQAATSQDVASAVIVKTKQEVENLQSVNDQVKAVTRNLSAEYVKMLKEGRNLDDIQRQIQMTINKMGHEIPLIRSQQFLNEMNTMLAEARRSLTGAQTRLANVDANAAEAFGEMGKTVGTLRPVLDLLWNIFRR